MAKPTSNRGILFTIFITVFMNLLGVGIIIPIIAPLFLDTTDPILPEAYTFAERTMLMGILIASYPIAQFFGAPILGSLSDAHGRRKILLLALAGTVIGYLLFGLGIVTKNIPLLFLGRIIDGLTGGNIAIINSSIADISKLKDKTKNFGLVGMAFGLGFIVGPFLGGKLSDPRVVEWFNYATPFWVAAGLILLNILLVIYKFPETLKVKKTGKFKFRTGIEQLSNITKLEGVNVILATIFLVTFGFTFFTQFFQVFLIEKFDYNQGDIGEIFAYLGIWIAFSQGVITRGTSHFFKPSHILSVSTIGLSIVLIILLLPERERYLFYILPFLAMFQGLNQPNLLSLLSSKSSDEMQGEVMGVNQSLQSLALAIPPIIAGFVVSLNIELPIILASVCLFASWIIVLVKIR